MFKVHNRRTRTGWPRRSPRPSSDALDAGLDQEVRNEPQARRRHRPFPGVGTNGTMTWQLTSRTSRPPAHGAQELGDVGHRPVSAGGPPAVSPHASGAGNRLRRFVEMRSDGDRRLIPTTSYVLLTAKHCAWERRCVRLHAAAVAKARMSQRL